jgi:hypothetical protein
MTKMLTNRELLNRNGYFSIPKAIHKMVLLPNTTLSAEESEGFIERMWDNSRMKLYARKVKMKAQTKNIRALSWGTGDFFYPEAQFDKSKVKTAFGDDTIALASKEVRGGLLIKDSDYEDLTIGTPAQFKAHLFSMLAKRIAREVEECAWIGDTQSLSGFGANNPRSLFDGWRYRLDHSQSGETYENDSTGSTTIMDASNTVTAAAADYTVVTTQGIAEQRTAAPYGLEIKFGRMVQELPSDYMADGIDDLRFFVNDKIVSIYSQALQDRGTPLGDKMVEGRNLYTANGIPIVPCPLIPLTMKIDTVDAQKEAWVPASGDLTDCVLTKNGNFIIAFHLELKMETARSAEDAGNIYYFRMRFDVAVDDVAGAVLLKRLKAA